MKKLILCLAAVLLTTGISALFMSAKNSEDTVSASAYVLMEAKTCTVLESEDPDKQLNAGYLSKLMSLLLIAEDIETGKYSLSTEITAPQSVYGTRGSVVWLEPGDKMTVEELIKSVIIGNANDALTALAETSERSVDDFVMRMNSEAFDLGLRNTAFYSPYGYYDDREHTTAADIAVICARLTRFEFLEPYFRTWRDFVKEGTVELVSEDTLARTYDRHCGFKACHSEEAGYCIAEGGRSENGTVYIAVVLGAPDEDSSFSAAKTLVKKGFSNYKVTAATFPEEMLRPVRVRDGAESAVEIGFSDMESIVVPRGVRSLSTTAVIPQYVSAPVRKGQKIGIAAFYSGDTLVCETDIVAKSKIDRLTVKYVFNKLLLKLLEK